MTRIEKVVREISDLRNFYSKIANERKLIDNKNNSTHPHLDDRKFDSAKKSN